MGFLSAKASNVVNRATGSSKKIEPYLQPGDLKDGFEMRFAILSPEPLEYFCIWGETREGREVKRKPFYFPDEPNQQDILQELGDYTQEVNKSGQPKPAALQVSFFGFDYFDYSDFEGMENPEDKDAYPFRKEIHSDNVKLISLSQGGLIKELYKITQQEDYEVIQDHDLIISRSGTGLDTRYSIMPAPRRKGMQQAIDKAWADAKSNGYDLNQHLVKGNPFGEEL